MTIELIEPAAEAGEDATAGGTVRVTCTATEHVGLAYNENAIPVVREIIVSNATGEDLLDVRVRIESRPAVVRPLTLRINRVPAGSYHHVETPSVRLDAGMLTGFTEAGGLDLPARGRPLRIDRLAQPRPLLG